MAKEIERKFLVRGDSWRGDAVGIIYRQGYITAGSRCTVRVRIGGDRAFLTVKGPSQGMVRDEYEYPIPIEDAEEMLGRLSEDGRVEKVRYRIPHVGRVWEIDEFTGENAGLVVAEVELEREDEEVEIPEWVGVEVTDDQRYTNSALARRPWRAWRDT